MEQQVMTVEQRLMRVASSVMRKYYEDHEARVSIDPPKRIGDDAKVRFRFEFKDGKTKLVELSLG